MKFGQFRNSQRAPFHSNAYARAANGDAMGVVSSQSFRQRQHIERNRQVVGRYDESYVAYGNDHLRREARSRANSSSGQSLPHEERRVTARSGGVSRFAATPGASKLQVPARKPSFVEPPGRGYNPYQ